MSPKKIKGLFRLGASVTASVILLPFILKTYLILSPNADANEIWISLIQAAPFGESIATVVLAVWGEAKSGLDSLVDWFLSQKLSFPQYFSMELGELIFTSVIVLVISSLIGRRIFYQTEGGIFDHAANAVFQVLLTFTASLVVDIILDTFVTNLAFAEGLKHDITAWVYALTLSAGGIWMLIAFGVIFLNAILLVAIGCLKLTTSYGFFLWLVQVEIQHESGWMLAVGVVMWLIMIWLLQSLESIFLPK